MRLASELLGIDYLVADINERINCVTAHHVSPGDVRVVYPQEQLANCREIAAMSVAYAIDQDRLDDKVEITKVLEEVADFRVDVEYQLDALKRTGDITMIHPSI